MELLKSFITRFINENLLFTTAPLEQWSLFGCPENVRIFVFLLNLSRCQYILGKLHNNFLLVPNVGVFIWGICFSYFANLSRDRSTKHRISTKSAPSFCKTSDSVFIMVKAWSKYRNVLYDLSIEFCNLLPQAQQYLCRFYQWFPLVHENNLKLASKLYHESTIELLPLTTL